MLFERPYRHYTSRSGAQRKRFGFESSEVENFRGVLNVDADDLAFFIEVDDHAVLNLARIDARARVQVDVERIGFAIVVELHVDSIMKPEPQNFLQRIPNDSKAPQAQDARQKLAQPGRAGKATNKIPSAVDSLLKFNLILVTSREWFQVAADGTRGSPGKGSSFGTCRRSRGATSVRRPAGPAFFFSRAAPGARKNHADAVPIG